MLLDIHGLVIACETSSPELTEALIRPFQYFRTTEGSQTATIVVKEAPPPYADFPPLPARFSTPRNVVYQSGGVKIIDYYGKGAVIHDSDQESYIVHSADRNLLIEVFYLLVLSLLGQFCDRTWRLRVHALALSHRDRAFLFMMPSGTGKSTLGLTLLQQGVVRYISDDDPLFDRTGHILPFPRPIGILDRERLRGIPDRFIYRVDRMEFGPKYLVDAAFWADRIETRALDRIVLVTTSRVLNGPTRIEPVSHFTIFSALMRDAVVGIGLFQGLEFLADRSLWELAGRVPAGGRRLVLARQLARSARPYRLTVSRDVAETGRVVREFIERFPDGLESSR